LRSRKELSANREKRWVNESGGKGEGGSWKAEGERQGWHANKKERAGHEKMERSGTTEKDTVVFTSCLNSADAGSRSARLGGAAKEVRRRVRELKPNGKNL